MSSAQNNYNKLDIDMNDGFSVGDSGGSADSCPFCFVDEIDSASEWMDGWRIGNRIYLVKKAL